MEPRYYAAEGQRDSIDDLVRQVEQQAVGELYLSDHFRGIKIIYDSNTGRVSPQSIDNKPGVNESYNPKLLHPILQPVTDTLSFLAKVELVRSLDQLTDPGLSNKIDRVQFEARLKTGKVNAFYLEQLFNKLTQSSDPKKNQLFVGAFFKANQASSSPSIVQQAVKDVFRYLERDEKGFLKLESKQRVKEIMESIQVRIAELRLYSAPVQERPMPKRSHR